MDWCRARGDAEAWLRLAGALHQFWFMRGHLTEGREWLEAALAASKKASAAARALALCGAGLLAWRQGDLAAEKPLQESLALFQGLQDQSGVGYVLHHLAHVAEKHGDYARVRALFEESLARFREAGDRWGIGWTLFCLGGMIADQGDDDRATALFEESLVLCREVGNAHTMALVLGNLGMIAARQGDYQRAAALLEEGLATARRMGDKFHIPFLECEVANVSLAQGHTGRAGTLYRDSLVLQRDTGVKSGLAPCVEGLAAAASAQGHRERAARLFGAAEALRETVARPFARYSGKFVHDRRMATARAALRAKSLDAAWAEGRKMTLEQVIEYALEWTTPTESKATGNKKLGKVTANLLTRRERDVVALVAHGLTNRQIAAKLVVTERTAESHVHNILDKLAFTSRAQIAVWATEQGLRLPAEQ
jgi:non-specific serine/threonine protein kinase